MVDTCDSDGTVDRAVSLVEAVTRMDSGETIVVSLLEVVMEAQLPSA